MDNTPASTRRTTRSLAAAERSKQEESSLKTKSDRMALLDITNDSPIVGVAAGAEKTPSSDWTKSRRALPKQTPGSGEALLRGQVKTLLQKVVEECGVAPGNDSAAVVSAAAPRMPPIATLLGIARSPAQLLAPTPANTPQVPQVAATGVVESIPPAAEDASMEEEEEQVLSDCLLNRALQFDDLLDKSEGSAGSSAVTLADSSAGKVSQDDDSSSAWSIQVNPGSHDGSRMSTDEDEYYDELEGEEGCEEELDVLCDGISKITVREGTLLLPEFKGKHTRFVYDEESGEMTKAEEEEVVSPSVTVLRGMPAPEGKHLRFQETEDDHE